MNKLVLILLSASLVIGGCQKKIADTIDGQTVDQRLSAALAAYQKLLVSAPYGWTVVEYTTGSAVNQGLPTAGQTAAFAYYMQFNDSNQVTMFSDFDTTTVTAKSSSYRLKATQRPSLIFDTYSYIHIPCDPDPTVSKSPFGPGLGWGADFEFSFADNVSATALGDTINLTGNLNGASAMMIKATKAQHDAYYDGTFAKDFIFTKIQNYFKNLSLSGRTYQITPGLGTRSIDVSWISGTGVLETASTNFYQIADAIGFRTPFQGFGTFISGLQGIVYDPNTSTATATVGNAPATITGVITPLQLDPNGPANWYFNAFNNFGLYISNNGFHIDGVDDYFQLDTLTFNGAGFNTYVYYPGLVNSGALDAFVPFFNSGYPSYADVTFPTLLAPGVLAIVDAGNIGGPLPPVVAAMDSVESDPNGYYMIVKEDGSSYDQVNTTDAKTWISWTFVP